MHFVIRKNYYLLLFPILVVTSLAVSFAPILSSQSTATVLAFGAVADGIMRNDGQATAGSAKFTSAAGSFAASDVGKYIQIVGAGPGGTTHSDGSISAGSYTLTSASASFASSDIGRGIVVLGAGSGGGNLVTRIQSYTSTNVVQLAASAATAVSSAQYFYGAMTLEATIASVQSPTTVILNTPANSTISSAEYAYGTDNHVAFQTALDSAGQSGGGTVSVPAPSNCPTGAICGYVVKASDQMTANAPGAVKIRYSNLSLVGDSPQTNLFCRGAYASYTNSKAYPSSTGNIRGFCLNIGDNGGPNGAAGEAVSNITISHLHLYGMTDGNTFNVGFSYPPQSPNGDGWDVTHKAIYMWDNSAFSNIIIDSVILQDFKAENIYSGGSPITGMVIKNSTITNFNGNGISMLAADLQVLNNTISNGSNAAVENSTVSAGGAALVRQIYQGNTISNFPREGIVVVGVDGGVASGNVQILGNYFDTIGVVNGSGTQSAVYVASQNNFIPPANVTVSSNTCHDCYSLGVLNTSGNTLVQGNTFTVDHYSVSNFLAFMNPMNGTTISNNTGSATASAQAQGKTIGSVYQLNPGYASGGFAWKNVVLSGNSWTFPGAPQYQFVTTSGLGWGLVTQDNLNWQGDICNGCSHADANHGLVDLSRTTVIEPFGPAVYVTDSAGSVTATIDARREENGAQIQIVNVGPNPVTFVSDANLSLTSPVTLSSNGSATFIYTSALSKFIAYQATGGGSAATVSPIAGNNQSALINTGFGTALQALVSDANNNPVAGVVVTFSAPGSGASCTFGGATTITATSAANGVASAPVAVANGQTGTFNVTATVGGISSSATFSLTNTAASGQNAALSGSGDSSLAMVNLTAEGGIDWEHWGESPVNHKASGGSQIGNVTVVGSGQMIAYNNDLRPVSWTDGGPTLSSSNNADGIYVTGLGQGFTFNVPADQSARTLIVHVGGWYSGGTFRAHLTDNSAADFTDLTSQVSNQYDRNYRLTYRAASAGQALQITWTMSSGPSYGNVTLNAASLVSSSLMPVSGTPQSTSIGTAFNTPLQVLAVDNGGNPISGLAIVFSAPASGPSGTFGAAQSASVTTNASGIATAPTLTANNNLGSYQIQAQTSAMSTTVAFALTNLAGPPSSVSASSGSSQSATINTGFSTILASLVQDSKGNPVSGATVVYSAPTSGASATFAGASTVQTTTNSAGLAMSPGLTADGQVGSYVVSGSVAGVAAAANFQLTNLTGGPAKVTATAGSSQSAGINSTFATALQALVTDASNNPVSGVTVTFSTPSAGASASFSGTQIAQVTTNSSGLATTPVLTANSQAGAYSVSASVSGVSTSATYALSNTAITAPVQAGIHLVQQIAASNPGNNQYTLTANLGATPSAANTMVLAFNQLGTAQTITSITGGNWTRIAKNYSAVGDSEVWVGTNATSKVVTITGATYFGTFQPGYVTIAEFAGVGSTLDGTPSLTTGGSWPVTNNNFTTTTSGDLLISLAESYNGGGSGATVSQPWKLLSTVPASFSLAASYQVTSAPGNYPVVWNGFGSPQVSTIVVALKPSSANTGTIGSSAGSPQTLAVNTIAPVALQAVVKDGSGNPLSGTVVTFAAPTSGASATFSGSATATAVTNSNGIASAPSLTTNTQPGSYTITATAATISNSATFQFTNIAGPAASITATSGSQQSAAVGAAFTKPLQAAVQDSYGNPVSAATVTFAAPASGASCGFGGQSTLLATTDASGVATASSCSANSQTGAYSVTASVNGLSTPAVFSLTNSNIAVPAKIAVVQQAAGSNPGNNKNALNLALAAQPSTTNVLILFFDQLSAAQNITSISGATWSRLSQNYTPNNGDSEIWVGTNPTSSAITITGTTYFGTFQPGYATVVEFSGLSANIDGSPKLTTGSAWPASTGTLQTGSPGDLLLTSTLTYNGGGSGAIVSAPWTVLATTPNTFSQSAAYLLTSATGTYSAVWNGFGSPPVATTIVALKAAGVN